jgi:hypothetical protein
MKYLFIFLFAALYAGDGMAQDSNPNGERRRISKEARDEQPVNEKSPGERHKNPSGNAPANDSLKKEDVISPERRKSPTRSSGGNY